jgi:transcriptional regulator with XRE-family HTH domain
MDLRLILSNIERLLTLKGMSADKASRLAGKPDAIRNIKRKLDNKIKGTGVTVETLNAIAEVLGTNYAGLSSPREQIRVHHVTGLREEIIKKIEWLDAQRAQAIEELEAIDRAEPRRKKPVKRAARR